MAQPNQSRNIAPLQRFMPQQGRRGADPLRRTGAGGTGPESLCPSPADLGSLIAVAFRFVGGGTGHRLCRFVVFGEVGLRCHRGCHSTSSATTTRPPSVAASALPHSMMIIDSGRSSVIQEHSAIALDINLQY